MKGNPSKDKELFFYVSLINKIFLLFGKRNDLWKSLILAKVRVMSAATFFHLSNESQIASAPEASFHNSSSLRPNRPTATLFRDILQKQYSPLTSLSKEQTLMRPFLFSFPSNGSIEKLIPSPMDLQGLSFSVMEEGQKNEESYNFHDDGEEFIRPSPEREEISPIETGVTDNSSLINEHKISSEAKQILSQRDTDSSTASEQGKESKQSEKATKQNEKGIVEKQDEKQAKPEHKTDSTELSRVLKPNKIQEERSAGDMFRKEMEKTGISLQKEGLQNGSEKLIESILDPKKWSIHRSSQRESENQSGLSEKFSGRIENRKNRSSGKEGKGMNDGNQGSSSRREGSISDSIRDNSSLFNIESTKNIFMEKAETNTEMEAKYKQNRRLYDDLVQKAKVSLRSDGSSSASIRLRPAHLGRMTLNLEVMQSQVRGKIIVENDAVRRIVAEELEYLKSELSRQGIQVESFSIRVRDVSESSQGSDTDTLEESHENQEKDLEKQNLEKDEHLEHLFQEKEQRNSPDETILKETELPDEYGTAELRSGVQLDSDRVDIRI